MPAPTEISVSVDADEYSRYEEGRQVVTATVTLSGGGSYTDEDVEVSLIKARRSRDAEATSEVVSITGSAPQTFTVTFDLRNIVDQDLINQVRFGKYFVRATSQTDEDVYGDSSDFDVSILTVDRFKSDFLFGLDLTATDQKYPKFQPQNITGVTITEVSRTHYAGGGTLSYIYSNPGTPVRMLSWSGGPAVSITGPGVYTLLGSVSPVFSSLTNIADNYIVVRVGALTTLPTTSITDSIIIDRKTMTDESLRRYISQAVSYVENEVLHGYIEPTNIVSEADPTIYMLSSSLSGSATPILVDADYDFIKTPLTHYPPKMPNWISIQFPFPKMLRVDALSGSFGNMKIVNIDPEWIQLSQTSGFVQVAPFSPIAWDFFGGYWINFGRSGREIPNFWHYNVIAGIRECTPDIQELIGRYAAITALTAAGQAIRPGIGSTSLSRDGVSQSVSYLASAKYGLFTGPITTHKEWIADNQKKIVSRYRGMPMIVP